MNLLTREAFTDSLLTAAIRPRLTRELRYVPEEITDWKDRDFLAILTKNKSEGILVIPGEPTNVLPFSLLPRKAGSSGRVEAIICDICATWQRGTHSAAITFTKEKRSVSFLVCDDLDCSLHVRGKTNTSVLARAQLREDLSPEARIARLNERLARIVTIVRA